MIHLFYLSLIGLIVLFGGRRISRIRRAFLAACDRRDIEIEARQQAEIRIAKDAQALGAARRREMKYLASIESQREQLKEFEALKAREQKHLGLIALAKDWARDIREGLDLGGKASLPATANRNGAVSAKTVRVTGRLNSAPIFSGRAQ